MTANRIETIAAMALVAFVFLAGAWLDGQAERTELATNGFYHHGP